MGPEVVVVVPPGFQFLAGVGKAGGDRLVQELIAQARIEAFDEPVLVGLPRRDLVPLDIAFLRPAQDRHTGQLDTSKNPRICGADLIHSPLQ